MVCLAFTGITTIGDLLVWPTGCFYFFYLVVFVTIFITLTLILYNKEKEDLVKSDIVSSLGVSSIVTLMMALIGTLIKNTDGIPMVQNNVFLIVLAYTIVFILIWFFKK